MLWAQHFYQILDLAFAVYQRNEFHISLPGGLHERLRPTVHYLPNSFMFDLSWLSPIKCTMNFRISVNCQFSFVTMLVATITTTYYLTIQLFICPTTTNGSLSIDQFGLVLLSDQVFQSHIIVVISQPYLAAKSLV